jgi:molybdenum cofactor biosynthesis protein B
MSAEEHKKHAAASLHCMVVTLSDSRDASQDKSGDLAQSLLEGAGHRVSRTLMPNEREELQSLLQQPGDAEVIICTGGTGLGPRDITAELVARLLDKELPGFGELFRMLSYQEIGSAAMLSRAVGGAMQGRLVFALPGSSKAVRLALEKLIIPELGHLHRELRGRRPIAT